MSSIYAPLVSEVPSYMAVFQVLPTEYQRTLTVLKMHQKLKWKNHTYESLPEGYQTPQND